MPWNTGLYPNPAQNDLFISSHNKDDKMLVTITDVNGRLLLNEQMNIHNNSGKLRIDLQNGVYFVTLVNKNNEHVVKKLVISK